MTLRADLDVLARNVREKATVKDTPLQESIDALKALTAYYAICEKVKLKAGDDSGGGNPADFNAFGGAIHGADREEPSNGRPAPAPANRRRVS